jgi:disulfide bond formation protein DsbB
MSVMQFSPRPWFLFVALACAGMLTYALYVQHFDFIDPCPLCVLQRMAYMWIGAVALLAFIHNPGPSGRWVYGLGVIAGGLTGIGIAGRHVWPLSVENSTLTLSGSPSSSNNS